MLTCQFSVKDTVVDVIVKYTIIIWIPFGNLTGLFLRLKYAQSWLKTWYRQPCFPVRGLLACVFSSVYTAFLSTSAVIVTVQGDTVIGFVMKGSLLFMEIIDTVWTLLGGLRESASLTCTGEVQHRRGIPHQNRKRLHCRRNAIVEATEDVDGIVTSISTGSSPADAGVLDAPPLYSELFELHTDLPPAYADVVRNFQVVHLEN
ncbi:uncharacterized protein LOC129599153 [Paramacrobiotus metropolitanus]|uniref:uncharacterized protein LOC129599153 n=1 Tax=Paramacrobiotus metropolitanus TaxID=2943436 RepID=UPI002445A6F1|nr:uncharacterized protein LOC129599153 [Paramacrobiotus metropolitanus]